MAGSDLETIKAQGRVALIETAMALQFAEGLAGVELFFVLGNDESRLAQRA